MTGYNRMVAITAARQTSVPMSKLLTLYELADRLGVSPRTVARYVEQGRLPGPVRLSRKSVRWREEDISAAIAALSGGE
jgi:prophage regulatory protein